MHCHVIPGTGGEEKKMEKDCLAERWEFDGKGIDYRMVCTGSRNHTGDHCFEYNGQFIGHQHIIPKVSAAEIRQYGGLW